MVALCSTRRTTPQFFSAVRRTDSKQKAWGAIWMWSPPTSLRGVPPLLIDSLLVCRRRPPRGLWPSFFGHYFIKQKKCKPANYCFVSSVREENNVRKIDQLCAYMYCSRGPLNLTSHRELVFCATTSKRQKGCVVMSIYPYTHTWIII